MAQSIVTLRGVNDTGKLIRDMQSGAYTFMPDYANQETLNRTPRAVDTWTADRNGFVYAAYSAVGSAQASMAGSVSISILVNGNYAARAFYKIYASNTVTTRQFSTMNCSGLLPVSVGDVISFTSEEGTSSSVSILGSPSSTMPNISLRTCECYFIPRRLPLG